MEMRDFVGALRRACAGMEVMVVWGSDFGFRETNAESFSLSYPCRFQPMLRPGVYRRSEVAVLRIECVESEERNRLMCRGIRMVNVTLLDYGRLDSPDRGIRTYSIPEAGDGTFVGQCVIDAVAGGTPHATTEIDAERGDVCGLVLCSLAAMCVLLQLNVEL
jgi:hypothetical protein